MIKIKAKIKVYEHGRTTSFNSGYRPLFNFIDEMKKSGQITLIDREKFFPGDEAEVEIVFLNKRYLGDNLQCGAKFTFGEGRIALGEGEVREVCSIDT